MSRGETLRAQAHPAEAHRGKAYRAEAYRAQAHLEVAHWKGVHLEQATRLHRSCRGLSEPHFETSFPQARRSSRPRPGLL